ncbi:hypothetical protein TIFTF001_020303 [Ficus carica]|uniref:Uncharacterized protein n=1 Tax=Ficus carica TaxID=3494 RepID=A0AA88ARF9_FICCA|nr:hypothetical protein TIFTF001_020303 [Ficus carica]
MLKIPPAPTPSVVGWSSRGWPITQPSIICKREAPRGDRDTGVVSAVGTPMLKSAPPAGLGARGDPTGSATYSTQGVTRLRLARATGPMDWHHVGPDPAQGTGGWLSPAPAGVGAPSTTLPEYMFRPSETVRVGRIITPGWTKSGSRFDSEQSRIVFPLSRVVGICTLWSGQITTST